MPFISCISCSSLWIDSSRIPEVTRALQVNWPWDEAYGIISRLGDLCNDNVHSLKDTASNANMDSVKAARRVHPVSSMCRRQSMAQVFRIWDCSSQERVCWLLVLNSVRRSSYLGNLRLIYYHDGGMSHPAVAERAYWQCIPLRTREIVTGDSRPSSNRLSTSYICSLMPRTVRESKATSDTVHADTSCFQTDSKNNMSELCNTI